MVAASCCALAGSLPAQQKNAIPRTLVISGMAAAEVPGNTVREIDDPYNGDHWLLERDPEHPGGPGRLVRVAHGTAKAVASDTPAVYRPVIHAGDKIVVEENTPVAEARLAAVALTPAEAGAELTVRLEIGGAVLRAIAFAPGRAELAPESGAQP